MKNHDFNDTNLPIKTRAISPFLMSLFFESLAVLTYFIRKIEHMIMILLLAPWIRALIYPKGAKLNTSLNPDCVNQPKNILEQQKHFMAIKLKKDPGTWSFPEFENEAGVKLRGLCYKPPNYDPKNGFVFIDSTNSSSIQVHHALMLELAHKMGKAVIGVNHRGLNWSDGVPPLSTNAILRDHRYCVDKQMDMMLNELRQKGSTMSKSEFASKVLLYGHSFGGGISIINGDYFHRCGLPVKVFSWASYSRLSSVPRELIGGFLIRLFVSSALMYALFSYGLFTSYFTFFCAAVLSLLGVHVILAYLSDYLYPFIEEILIAPVMKFLGWQLTPISHAKYLYQKGYLETGHIGVPLQHVNSDQIEKGKEDYLRFTGQDTFIGFKASITYSLKQERKKVIDKALQSSDTKAQNLLNIVDGSIAYSRDAWPLSGFLLHAREPHVTWDLNSKTQVERICKFTDPKYTEDFQRICPVGG